MTWLIIILAVIVLLYVRRLFNKRIDATENKRVIRHEMSLWDGLCIKFQKYLDFTQISLLSDKMEIANQKGETFNFQKDLTDIIVSYKLNGKIEKTWKFPFWVAVNTAYKNIDEYYRSELQPKASIKHVTEMWKISNSRHFTNDEISAISSNRVVKSQYGLSVEFSMKKGGVIYIPLLDKNILSENAEINLQEAQILTLSKKGVKDIYRIKV